jgi:hypothetical protein
MTSACETAEGRALLPPVEDYVEFLRGLDDGTGSGRRREVFVAAIAPVTDDAAHEPARCRSDTDEAYGVGRRYRELTDALGDHGFIGSICADGYGDTLRGIAHLVSAPQTLDLPGDPVDGRLLRVVVLRASGGVDVCTVGGGFTYEPRVGDAPARVTMRGDCLLENGDAVRLERYCAS